MKKAIDSILPVAMAIAIAGLVFKLLHWPGANIILIIGLGTVAIQGMFRLALEEGTGGKFGGVAIAALAMGFLFKLMHWPGAQVLLIGALAMGIVAMIMIMKERKSE